MEVYLSSTTLNDGQILIGSTSHVPAAATISAVSNQTSITNGPNSITIGTVQHLLVLFLQVDIQQVNHVEKEASSYASVSSSVVTTLAIWDTSVINQGEITTDNCTY